MDQTTRILADYSHRLKFEDLPAGVVHQAKRTLIDALGCAVGGFYSKPSEIARKLAQSVQGSSPARILGATCSSSPDMAGFANGVMIRCLDFNDAYFSPGGGHPSDMIPAILALAEPFNRDGKTIITAMVLAYEVFCRLSDAVVISNQGWDQGLFSGVGAVCGAGKMMGLNPDAMGHAIALTVVPNLPLLVTRTGELSMWKGCATASATRAAIFAAQLAGLGMTGPEAAFDSSEGLWAKAAAGPVELSEFDNSVEPHRLTRTLFKSFPAQIHTQGPIDLALDLQPQVVLSEIENIRIQTYQVAVQASAMEPEKWAPRTRETADHSIPYTVAAAFLDGDISRESFADGRLKDPELLSLVEKIQVEEDAALTKRYPEAFPCRMEVTTGTGRNLVAELVYPPGHWRNPLSDEQLEAKFVSLTSGVISKDHCKAALDMLWSLDRLPGLTPVYDALVIAR